MTKNPKWIPTRKQGEVFSVISQFLHLIRFWRTQHRPHFDHGIIVTSIDVDVGSPLLGKRNKGRNDANIHPTISEARVGGIEEQTIPLLLRFFDGMEIPVTFAVRGQLTELNNTVLESILRSPVRHDIGAHGYSHKVFSKMSEIEARREMELISKGFGRFGLQPRSFVFPRNKVAHLHILEECGYTSFREAGNLLNDGMYIKRIGRMYDIHPSFHLGSSFTPAFLNQIIDISAKQGLPFHLWFHPRDLCETISFEWSLRRVVFPIFSYAKKKADQDQIRFETMKSTVALI
jgi:peptidoglycan/xylan/chitin deacetylase (PgdA/CDA1 family)